MKRLSALLLTILILTLSLAGCGSQNTADTSSNIGASSADAPIITDNHSNDGRTVIGISMPDQLLERWNKDGAYLQSHFLSKGYEVILRFSDNLIDRQINGIREMIDGGADLIVISAVDGAALSSILDEASQANITIIAYDRLLMDTDVVDYYVSFDNYEVGVLQAEYVIDALDLDNVTEPKTIEFVTGDPVDNNARYFYNGAMDTLSPYIDAQKLNVVSGQMGFYETATGQWSTDLAQQRIQIILNSYYVNKELDAILCANDSTALGATLAISSDYAHKNNVVITGQDADLSNVYNILEGTQSMTVFKTLSQESIVTVDLATAILEGKTPGEELIKESGWDFSCTYSTSDYNNGRKDVTSYLLKPIVVDKANIEKILFDGGYYTRNSAGLIVATK